MVLCYAGFPLPPTRWWWCRGYPKRAACPFGMQHVASRTLWDAPIQLNHACNKGNQWKTIHTLRLQMRNNWNVMWNVIWRQGWEEWLSWVAMMPCRPLKSVGIVLTWAREWEPSTLQKKIPKAVHGKHVKTSRPSSYLLGYDHLELVIATSLIARTSSIQGSFMLQMSENVTWCAALWGRYDVTDGCRGEIMWEEYVFLFHILTL